MQTLTSYMKYEKQPRAPIPIPAVANEEELRYDIWTTSNWLQSPFVYSAVYVVIHLFYRKKAKEDLQSTDYKVDYFEMTQ